LEDEPARELDESAFRGDPAAPLEPLRAAPSHRALPSARRRLPPWDSLENTRATSVILMLVIVGGLALRTYGLYERSMWFDESISWRMVEFPFTEMIERTARDIHVPLFFVLLRGWTRIFGESIVALRNFSLAFSALAMLGVYLFTVAAMRFRGDSPHPLPLSQRERGDNTRRPSISEAEKGDKANSMPVSEGEREDDPHPQRLSHAVASDRRERGNSCPHPLPLSRRERGDVADARWVGLVATALFAVSLFQVRVAWEIRMYSLGTALVMFSSWLLVRALSARPTRGLPWMMYMLVGLLFAYTHYSALFSLAAQCLFAIVFLMCDVRWNLKSLLKDAKFRWFALAYSGMAAGCSPWLPVFLEQRRRIGGEWYKGPFSPSDVAATCYEMFFHPQVHSCLQGSAVIVTAVCGLVVVAVVWKGAIGQWLVACLVAAPLALMSLVSCVASNVMVARYMSFLQPFLLIAIAVALSRIRICWLRDLTAYLVVAAGLLLHLDFVDSLEIEKRPGASAAAAYIDSQRLDGEPVIACSPLLMFPTLFHSQNRQGWYVYSDRAEIPYYASGSILRSREILFDRDMEAVCTERAWIITTSGNWARWGLYIPPSWVKVSEERFPEVYAFQNDVVVICYRTR